MNAFFTIILLMQPASVPTTQPAAPPPANMIGDAKGQTIHRGAPFLLSETADLDTVMKKAVEHHDKTVKVSGEVSAVCRKKGCWMVLKGKTPGHSARITFANYSFFVPLDSAGANATVEGRIEVKKMGDAERKHLADDAGKPVDSIPAQEVRLVATAVEIRR